MIPHLCCHGNPAFGILIPEAVLSILEALILGIVQGITEFLPVSSSGHLVLLQKIFGIEGNVLLFDTLVHAGTLIAVCIVLWQDIWGILQKIIQPLTLFLVIATLPAVITALLFGRQIEAAFSSASFLGFAFLTTSALLLFSELLYRRAERSRGDPQAKDSTLAPPPPAEGSGRQGMAWPDALVIGLLQAVAMVPGISRSGATLSGGLFRRLNREETVRFSFLLSIPAIFGALIFQIKDLGKQGADSVGLIPLAIGAVSAAIVGFFSIRLLLKIVRERSLFGFAAYTGLLGFLVLLDRFGTHFFFKP